MARPEVLLTNDDGPPSSTSPYILELYQMLIEQGWSVRAVLPCTQKSWCGTSYSVASPHVRYCYYPIKDNFRGTHPDTDKCWSDTRRPIHKERGEIGEWILVDGTPSTCTNIGLFTSAEILDMPNAAPISLVLSGPNYGRNTGNAFSLSSGTLGAALAGATSGVRGIAMSYGHFQKDPPTPAHSASGAPLSASRSAEIARIATFYCTQIIKQLWDAWSKDVCVSAYSINVPLAETLLDPTVVWTRVWPSQLNKIYKLPFKKEEEQDVVVPLGVASQGDAIATGQGSYLDFRPNLSAAMRPPPDEPLPQGTDVWAICNGYIGIARFSASYTQPDEPTSEAPTCAL